MVHGDRKLPQGGEPGRGREWLLMSGIFGGTRGLDPFGAFATFAAFGRCGRGSDRLARYHRQVDAAQRPLDVQGAMFAGVLGKERRHAPRPWRLKRSRVQRIVRTLGAAATESRRGQLSLDPRVNEVGPVALDAHEGRADASVEGVIRILPAASHRLVHLRIAWLSIAGRVDLREADSQPARTSKQGREV